ncbi:MAG TPA: RluA family pseudouridine synthase [Myxococcota bacterium]|nr:RluA family pseudouridine synthase [Myxococcota bacterium]
MSDADEYAHRFRPVGSPAARRFDPPVRATRWLAPATTAWDAFVVEVGERAGLDAPGLARLLAHGGIWLDAHPVELAQPPGEVREGVHVAVYALAYEPEPVPLPDDAVLYDADGIVAANKPAWLPVQGTRASQRLSLEVALRERLGCPELRAAHRLDRQTSGVVLFARDGEHAGFLGRALQEQRVRRSYLALVSPAPRADEWTVTGPIGPARTPPRFRFELRDRASGDTRPSETHFRVLKRVGERALVECLPKTGRTHQLRVHLRHGGTPICGDDLYGPPYREGAATSASRVQLHAYTLRARVTKRGRELDLRAEPPADFESV